MTEATAFAHAIRSFPCRSTSVIRVVLLTIKNAPIVVLTKRSNTKANLHRTTLERARQITEKRYQQRVRLKLNLYVTIVGAGQVNGVVIALGPCQSLSTKIII